MRAVMASEAAHVAKTPTPTATRLLPRKSSDVFDSPRPSQPLPQSPTMTTGGPWKLSSPATPTRALPSVATPTKQSTRLPPATPPRPALGPVITPTRQPQASGSNNSPRRPSYVSLTPCLYQRLIVFFLSVNQQRHGLHPSLLLPHL